MSDKRPQWRVKFWFLGIDMHKTGWVALEWSFVEAKDRDSAIMVCAQRAASLGFKHNRDTRIKAVPEPGKLEPDDD